MVGWKGGQAGGRAGGRACNSGGRAQAHARRIARSQVTASRDRLRKSGCLTSIDLNPKTDGAFRIASHSAASAACARALASSLVSMPPAPATGGERGLEGDLSLPFGRRCWQRQHAHRTARGWRGSGAHRSNPHMHRVRGQIPEGDARGWGARVPGTGARSLHGRDGRPSAQDACANPRRILLPHAICSQFASTTPVPLVFVRLGKLVAAPSSRLGAEALAFKFTLGSVLGPPWTESEQRVKRARTPLSAASTNVTWCVF
jgi:hypothetical protein